MNKKQQAADLVVRRGAWMAALVSGILALVFAIVFLRWSAIVATADETRLAAMLVISAGIAGALVGGSMWRLMVTPGARYALLMAAIAGIVTIPVANLVMWLLFFVAMGILSGFSDPQGLFASFGSGTPGLGTIYLAFASTMLTGIFTLPLSVLGLLGVTLWCRRKLEEAPSE